jgi:8-oxo-dGTP pyrophosphatase MutT (NUDIX family)
MTDTGSKALPAATLLLLRDTPSGLEVFMVVRHHQIDFAAGALVFPGGKVADADRDPSLAVHCAHSEQTLAPETIALRVAAIRESFEESGILLARRRGSRQLMPADDVARLDTSCRSSLAAGAMSMLDLVVAEELELACDLLVPFARWITPEIMPKRYDTYFFLAAVPETQIAIHDGSEAVDSVWVSPREVLAAADAGRFTVIFPTRMNLAKLSRSRSVAEAITTARAARIVTVLPEVDLTSGVLRIPAEAGYDLTEASFDVLRADTRTFGAKKPD